MWLSVWSEQTDRWTHDNCIHHAIVLLLGNKLLYVVTVLFLLHVIHVSSQAGVKEQRLGRRQYVHHVQGIDYDCSLVLYVNSFKRKLKRELFLLHTPNTPTNQSVFLCHSLCVT